MDDPAMEERETADIETASVGYANRFAGDVGRYFLATQTRILLDLLRDFRSVHVLDVGGGHAQAAVPLVARSFTVTVTGSDDSCRARLDRSLSPGSFSYRTCDLLHMPFADKSFDVVVALRLLPHVRRWEELVEEMCRLARRSVIVDYPDSRSFNALYGPLFGMKKQVEGNTRPYQCFSREQIRNAFADQGFSSLVMRPQFFFPMVLHRALNMPAFSRLSERTCRLFGLNHFFGSPILLRADRDIVFRPAIRK